MVDLAYRKWLLSIRELMLLLGQLVTLESFAMTRLYTVTNKNYFMFINQLHSFAFKSDPKTVH